ncbi:MAG TPA: PAS domain-containing protein, partial [Verrucomicrobiae bacterium]|nr:PAS domain-containing protein [Verrucomicrobiae bacterium]
MPNFHYALKPGGFLFLGASESVGPFANLFEPIDRKQKIFLRKPGPLPAYHLPVSPGHPAEKKGIAGSRPGTAPETFRVELNAQREADRVTVNHFAPPSVLINADLEVLQFRGSTGAFLEPPSGKASFSVLKMAREGLMLPLRAAINKVKKEKKSVSKKNVRLNGSGWARLVNIEVIPLKNLKEQCYLVLFEEAGKTGRVVRGASPPEPSSDMVRTKHPVSKKEESHRIAELESELFEARDYAQSLQEQHEAANEELQASSEEVQSANEELQSINEELETSKEELESTNEELTTVNEEMANRNIELNRLNSDLSNLHVSINTAILLLGRDLTIRRFTPLAEKIFNLLSTDVGRPLRGVRHDLDFPELEELLTEVIDSVSPREREVQDNEGHWYLLRARPYLTLDNKVDGAVLVLLDINALKRGQQEITEARDYAQAVVEIVPPLLILDENLRVTTANESFYKHFRLAPAQTENRLVYELDKGQWNIPKLRQLLEEILPRNSFFKNFEVTHEFGGLGPRTLHLSAQRVDHNQRILLSIDD